MKGTRFSIIVAGLAVLPALLAASTVLAESAKPFTRSREAPTLMPPAARAPRINTYQQERLRSLQSGAAPLDTLRVLALQVQFSDSLMGGQPGSRRDELRDSTFFANELKHLRQYFDGASRENLTVAWTVAGGLYTMPKPMGYYGLDALEDVRQVELMQTLIDSADADVDFSKFDTFMAIHAGAGQETDVFDNSREQLFSSFFDRVDIAAAFPDSTVRGLATGDTLMGEPFLVDNFMMVPEDASQDEQIIGSLGIWAFEVGSRLGLLPLFDSTPAIPDSRGVGEYDIMSYGLFNTALFAPNTRVLAGFIPGFPSVFNRMIAGWVDPVLVDADAQIRLKDINVPDRGDTHCVRIPISESEYLLVVNRVHDTNFDSLFTFSDLDSNQIPDNTDSLGGAEFDFFLTDVTNPFIFKPDADGVVRRFVLTGSGLYIWHVDETVIRQMTDTGFLPNDFVSRKGVDLEEADAIQDLDNTASVFSFGSYFDSYRAGHNTEFGPGTTPASLSNGGAKTGITIRDVSAVDSIMTLSIEISQPYDETRTRWAASGSWQPPTPFDLNGSGTPEIVVFADTGSVYAFNSDGSEFDDADGNPSTIDPYILVPGAIWRGAPAFGDIDGGGDEEIVAAATGGRVYAWKRDGSEVFDGDGNPGTTGLLYRGEPIVAPPMLVDVTGDGLDEIAVAERQGDRLIINFIGPTGGLVTPNLPTIQPASSRTIDAQSCSPFGYGAVGQPGRDTEGIVVSWSDTSRAQYGITYLPVRLRSGAGSERWDVTVPPGRTLNRGFAPTTPPAVGDLDHNGFDDVVLTLSDGRLVIYSPRPIAAPDSPQVESLTVTNLRSQNPSAPGLGDVDGNGTLEIAVWDQKFLYLFENNGRLYTNWPRPFITTEIGDFPPLVFRPRVTSPLIGDLNGDGIIEVAFPTPEGTVHVFHGNGSTVPGWPRPIPSALAATAAVADLDAGGELRLITVGSLPLMRTVDAVSDTILTSETMVLSIQSLPGSSPTDKQFWSQYRNGGARLGRVTESNPLVPGVGQTADANSFMVYPNPVRDGRVNARIILNAAAEVRVEIYNLEGQRAFSQVYPNQNYSGVVQTPFDETIDVSTLGPGVYLLRLRVEGPASETFVKTFAILR